MAQRGGFAEAAAPEVRLGIDPIGCMLSAGAGDLQSWELPDGLRSAKRWFGAPLTGAPASATGRRCRSVAAVVSSAACRQAQRRGSDTVVLLTDEGNATLEGVDQRIGRNVAHGEVEVAVG